MADEGNDAAPEEAVAKPPPVLARMLEWTRSRQDNTAELYDDFLLYAERAVQDCASMQMGVQVSYKLKDVRDNTGKESLNNTLLLIFNFYCKLRQSVAQTFAATQSLGERMSFKELEILTRDFRIVPRLMPKEDLRLLWENLVDKDGHKLNVTLLDFDLFKVFFVRMALWAYHKPGLKKLVLTLEGFMPPPNQLIECFANYWHLPDSVYVVNFLRTVSRKTQGDYNFRSRGENNNRTRNEILADSTARTRPSGAAAGSPGGAKRPATSSSSVDMFGNIIKAPILTTPASPQRVVGLDPRPLFPQRPTLLPPTLANALYPQQAALLEVKRQADEAAMGAADDVEAPSTARSSSAGHRGGSSGWGMAGGRSNDDDEDEESDTRTDTHSVASSVASVFWDSSLEAQLHNLNAIYEPRLVNELARFCYVPAAVTSTEWLPTHGPLVDLGRVPGGSQVVIHMTICNVSGRSVHLDVSARNFQSEDTSQSTRAKALLPGMQRSLVTSFTVPRDSRTVLGFIDVAVFDVHSARARTIACPVFYRVDEMAGGGDEGEKRKEETLPRCTGGSLPDLLALRGNGGGMRRVGTATLTDRNGRRTHAPQTVSFATQKVQGVWAQRTGKHSPLSLTLSHR